MAYGFVRILILACNLNSAGAVSFPSPDSEGGWRRGPEAKLDAIFSYLKTTTRNGGLAVVHRGELVYERYFGLGHKEAAPNLASCGKMITSAAIGILLHERKDLFPEGLDQKVFRSQYLPEIALRDAAKRDIRLGELLAMSAGIRGNNPGVVHGREYALDPPGPDGAEAMRDEVAAGVTLWTKPGGGYSYATSSIHLVSMIIRHVTGTELEQYVSEKIAKRIGWQRWGFGYKHANLGHTPGGGGICLRASDMLRFGYLLLREGLWNDREVVPRKYVLEARRKSRFNPHFPYSLQFDVNTDGQIAAAPRDAFWKSGSGGHALYIVPSMDLVIWKLGGRDEQYAKSNTGLEPPEFAASDFGKTDVPAPEALRRTLTMVIEEFRK